MAGRVLALDVGEKRIGVAVSDALGLIAQPAGTIRSAGWGPDVERVRACARTHGAETVLCGLPLNMDGTRGPQAERVAAFAAQLEKAGLTVRFWDERLSTVTATKALIEGGLSRARRKDVVDQIAATVILQAYLDAQRGKGEGLQ